MAEILNTSYVTDLSVEPPIVFPSNQVKTLVVSREPIIPVMPDVCYVCDRCLQNILCSQRCCCRSCRCLNKCSCKIFFRR